nr:hypothetical protein [Chitinophagaceae bacterium]
MKSKIQFLIAMAVMLVMLNAVDALAQVPQLFNYQGIARDAKGNPLSNQTMTLKLSVLPTADASVAEYEETQTVKTNEFGLYTLQIGNGTAVTGAMKTVKWETGNKYIKVGIDPNGGNNFVDAGTNQLLSVPYAIYADKAGVAANGGTDKTRTGAVNSEAAHVAGDNRYLTRFYGLNLIGKSALYESAAGNIGLGTIAPGAKFSIFANSATNFEHLRLQNVSATGSGKFIMYNDGAASYATFTKYGSAVAGDQIPGLYPNANTLAFGNNGPVAGDGLGKFLISTGGNIGLAILKGSSKLKFHVDYTSENVGIGGNSVPVSRVHFNNTDGTTTDLRVTNNTTGHLVGDGLEIKNVGTVASIINKEASDLNLGSSNATAMTIDAFNNVGIGTTTPTYKLDVTHGGASGILSKSTGSFSVVDIDASSGDAALRFGNNGSLMWNTRNEPASNDYQIFQMSAGLERMRINSTTGNVAIGTATGAAKLHVLSTSTVDTAIFASANDASASNQIGVLGTYNTSGFGAGIVGRGFGGSVPPVGAQDIGVYGSSSGIAVWSNGPLRVTDGTQGTGKILTSDASGNASWSTFGGFLATTCSGTIGTGLSATSIYTAEEYDDANAYNAATGEFTAPATGVYQFNYSQTFASTAGATAYARIGLLKNGNFLPGTIFRALPSNTDWSLQKSVTVRLLAGDVIKVEVGNFSGVSISKNSNNLDGSFSGHRVN